MTNNDLRGGQHSPSAVPYGNGTDGCSYATSETDNRLMLSDLVRRALRIVAPCLKVGRWLLNCR